MAARSKIPEELEPAILEKAAEALTTRQIAAWLHETHGVRVDFTAVARLLKRRRNERAVVTQAVVAEKLAKEVTKDIDVLAAQRDRLCGIVDKLHKRALKLLEIDTPDLLESIRGSGADAGTILQALSAPRDATEVFLNAERVLVRVLDRRLHYAGADGDAGDAAQYSEAGERIRSRLDRLAADRGEGKDPSGAGPDAGR